MCGIAGVVSNGANIDVAGLRAATASLAHRGPDGDALWVGPRGDVALGHRRLAILDLSDAADQPMHYRGRYTLTYNGELYNYVELRQELRRRGHAFRSTGDTEVVLAAYAEYGSGCVDRFDGMFAFALWDDQERRLFCARDRFGEKPLYYALTRDGRFTFASEMKALFAQGIPMIPNRRMLFQFLAHDVVEDPLQPGTTFYQDVLSLQPAHTLVVEGGPSLRPLLRRYWDIPPAGGGTRSLSKAAEEFQSLFQESVALRLRSDVPVGSSLSGGLDSTSIVCSIARMWPRDGPRQHSFSARFDDPRLDEGRYIEAATAQAGVVRHDVWPDGASMAANLERLLHHQEEPVGGASVYAQFAVMELARKHETTVLLDGQGADETIGGYTRFFRPYLQGLLRRSPARFPSERAAIAALHGAAPAADARFFLEAFAPALRRLAGPVRRRYRSTVPSWVHPTFLSEQGSQPPPFLGASDLDSALRASTRDYGLRTLLRYADRNSMAFSREVRLPFLSHRLVEFAFGLPDELKVGGGWTKRVLREAMTGIIPELIRTRVDKRGFEPPQEAWMNTPPMAALVRESWDSLRQATIVTGNVTADAAWRAVMASLFLRRATG